MSVISDQRSKHKCPVASQPHTACSLFPYTFFFLHVYFPYLCTQQIQQIQQQQHYFFLLSAWQMHLQKAVFWFHSCGKYPNLKLLHAPWWPACWLTLSPVLTIGCRVTSRQWAGQSRTSTRCSWRQAWLEQWDVSDRPLGPNPLFF